MLLGTVARSGGDEEETAKAEPSVGTTQGAVKAEGPAKKEEPTKEGCQKRVFSGPTYVSRPTAEAAAKAESKVVEELLASPGCKLLKDADVAQAGYPNGFKSTFIRCNRHNLPIGAELATK